MIELYLTFAVVFGAPVLLVGLLYLRLSLNEQPRRRRYRRLPATVRARRMVRGY